MRKIIALLFTYHLCCHAQENVCEYKFHTSNVQKKLIHYFRNFNYQNHKSLNERLLLVHLDSRYSLYLSLPKNFLNLKITYGEDSLVGKYYYRLIHRKYKFNVKELKQDYEKTRGIEHLLLWGIYPDFLPFDEECLNTLHQPLGYDSYSLRMICHLALAYHWAKSFAQLDSSTQKIWTERFHQWQENIQKGLLYEKGYTDTGIEALLAYVFMDKFQEIPLRSLEEFLFYDRVEEGYPWDTQNKESNHHASLVALWLTCTILNNCQ